MSKVSINSLADYAKRVYAKPLPSDKFTLTLTRSHLQWLQRIVTLQIKTERAQLDYYIKTEMRGKLKAIHFVDPREIKL